MTGSVGRSIRTAMRLVPPLLSITISEINGRSIASGKLSSMERSV